MATYNINNIVNDVRICIDEIGKNDSDFVGNTDDSEMDTIIKSKIIDATNFVYGNADLNLLGVDVLVRSSVPSKVQTNKITYAISDSVLRFVQGKVSSWTKPIEETITPDDPLFDAALDEYVGATTKRPVILTYKDVMVSKSISWNCNESVLANKQVGDVFVLQEAGVKRNDDGDVVDSWSRLLVKIYECSDGIFIAECDANGKITDYSKIVYYQDHFRVFNINLFQYIVYGTIQSGETKNYIMYDLVGANAGDTSYIMYIPRFNENQSATSISINDKIYRAVVYYCSALTLITYNDKERAQEMMEIAMTLMGVTKTEQQ